MYLEIVSILTQKVAKDLIEEWVKDIAYAMSYL